MPDSILLVDDNRDFRKELSQSLMEMYNIEEAPSGQKALEILKNPHQIDLVILDVKLPDLKGTNVLNKIRELDEDLGVIILTAYSTKDTAIESLKGGADDYLEKPIDIEEAIQTIEKVLKKRRGEKDINSLSNSDKIERVKKFVERNCFKDVSLKDAADSVYLSPKYLSRIFKQKAGVSFNQYKLGVKIENAKKLLKDTSYTVNQISYKLGYKNPESFMRMFKKSEGVTPTEYRKK